MGCCRPLPNSHRLRPRTMVNGRPRTRSKPGAALASANALQHYSLLALAYRPTAPGRTDPREPGGGKGAPGRRAGLSRSLRRLVSRRAGDLQEMGCCGCGRRACKGSAALGSSRRRRCIGRGRLRCRFAILKEAPAVGSKAHPCHNYDPFTHDRAANASTSRSAWGNARRPGSRATSSI
jgi:hypothetical protein